MNKTTLTFSIFAFAVLLSFPSYALSLSPVSFEASGFPLAAPAFNFTLVNDEDGERNITTWLESSEHIDCKFVNGAYARYDVMQRGDSFTQEIYVLIKEDAPATNHMCHVKAQTYTQDITHVFYETQPQQITQAGGYGLYYIRRLLEQQAANFTENGTKTKTQYIYIPGNDTSTIRESELTQQNEKLLNMLDNITSSFKNKKELEETAGIVFVGLGIALIAVCLIYIYMSKKEMEEIIR